MEKKVEWDPKKSASNLKKHGISFEEAYTTFFDSNAVEFYDADNPDEESRFLLLGISFRLRLLLTCYCIRERDTIRIISARKATSTESKEYYK